MARKKSVFASKAERHNFYKLSRTWGERYHIYHNLPFLNVFELNDLFDFDKMESLALTKTEIDFLKKTSIDYTLCDENDRPLVCIEFDGLQDGKNVGKTYYSNKGFDPERQIKFETKLKVAHGSLFPYFIVGYSEFEELDPTVQLTIVDGIIGQISAGMYLRNRFSQGVTHTNLGLSDSEYKEMPPEEIDFLVEDWVMGQEVEASFTFDPIFREKENLLERLGTLIRKTQTQLLYLGSTEQVQLQSQPVRISERSISLGAIATIDTEDYKNVCVEVWLTNFDVPWLNTTSLLLNIAELLALARLKWLLESGPMR